MVNVELLQKTLDVIKAHPETWSQSDWFRRTSCGTAFCFAGHAAILSGFPQPPADEIIEWEDADGVTVDKYAQKALGLTPEQARILFFSGNSLRELEYMVGKLIENPDATWRDLSVTYDNGSYCSCALCTETF